jgi:hypothetical protein
MSKVIEGAEVHGSMFEVWRHWWVTAVGDRCWRKVAILNIGGVRCGTRYEIEMISRF